MSDWTYESQVDLTNGGADDQTQVTIASGLSSSIIEIDIMFHSISLDANNTDPLFRLGDAGGVETTGYRSTWQAAGNADYETDGFHMHGDSLFDAADTSYGLVELFRWDNNEHLWLMKAMCGEDLTSFARLVSGDKTLSNVLTQIVITTPAGTANFDGGEARIRYRT